MLRLSRTPRLSSKARAEAVLREYPKQQYYKSSFSRYFMASNYRDRIKVNAQFNVVKKMNVAGSLTDSKDMEQLYQPMCWQKRMKATLEKTKSSSKPSNFLNADQVLKAIDKTKQTPRNEKINILIKRQEEIAEERKKRVEMIRSRNTGSSTTPLPPPPTAAVLRT
ncbi:unnamed protein product [Dimorphilus gyrociliatus]|uniref:Uncharacterized protein n=1 Tax=Dimorphilus gyrociliatus TaxID=2664684 RepID=A0A7I8W5Z1_9ANNE|nr:unnamed protein product [Dimorphilus gyrociliatus]